MSFPGSRRRTVAPILVTIVISLTAIGFLTLPSAAQNEPNQTVPPYFSYVPVVQNPEPLPTPDVFAMVTIPAGPFQMGCEQGDTFCERADNPPHEVTLSEYAIDKYEVTNARYALCVEDGACSPPHNLTSAQRSTYYTETVYADYPVIHVDWTQADTFCRWEGKRLPTEAEWEKAARGSSDARPFPWGNDTPNCNHLQWMGTLGGDTSACHLFDTTRVGLFPLGSSPYGAMDMAGNVSEYVNDWFQEEAPGIADPTDPQGPTTGDNRSARGGSWRMGYVPDFSISRRWERLTYSWFDFDGFRCAQTTN